MKVAGMLLILVALVTGVAVQGSRAQPLHSTSAAFRQCLGGAPETGDRCTLPSLLAVGEDIGGDRAIDQVGDSGWAGWGGWGEEQTRAENLSDPQLLNNMIPTTPTMTGMFELFVRAMEWARERFFGTGLPIELDTRPPLTVFDPAR
ncbi:MAG: hypothetical protein QN168_12135 [Armatimonadota bacterium]|nr:hypothetical protein [Armatimonadota bacterium]